MNIPRDATSETDPGPAENPSQPAFTEISSPANGIRYYRIKIVP
ncbi:hypothetical protein [Pedosphaera parvula]|uniref:Uncharacterized protein n=1 Tax=Pedosphaera parvula (strain Ellin514) TaxID=320771 RepID=B9XJI7_PEDPL|nr:hypothetical protein [Pedosphaera parvula]EEF60048.1 hypothetical protein Cflav_PD3107 [Pedosphaera parvula Ellin514]